MVIIKQSIVSPRALCILKHLKILNSKIFFEICFKFVIQRTDKMVFAKTSIVDPIYREAFGKAVHNGVQIIPISIKWKLDGRCYFEKEMILISNKLTYYILPTSSILIDLTGKIVA